MIGALLRPWAARLIGIDLSPDMIELARQSRIYDRLEVAEITAWLAACDQAHDVIVACDCLIYFGELGQVLTPAARRLAAGGLCGFTVEKGDQVSYRLTDSGRYAHHGDYVCQVASQSGLELVSQRDAVIRVEYGAPAVGIISVHRAPPPTGG